MTALPRPVNANGRTEQRWILWRARQRAYVMVRCRGRCEAPDCLNNAREAHHCFGRRHIIGEPLASHRAMLAGLCRDCHHAVTVEPVCGLALHLQWAAVQRAAQAFTVPAALLLDEDAAGAARYIERHLIARGEMDELREMAGLPDE